MQIRLQPGATNQCFGLGGDSAKILIMRISKGKVVDGQIVVEDDQLEEGAIVTVLVTDEREFQLSPEDENELLEAMAEADRGELVDVEDVLKEIQ